MKLRCVVRCLLLAVLVAFSWFPASGATTNLVRMANFNFSPAVLTITNGDTVMWSNTASAFPPTAHNTTSTNNNNLWSSGNFNSPNTFLLRFTNVGTYPYLCTLHTSFNQTGTVAVVSGSPNIPPTVTITNPVNNAVFSAPASFNFGAAASDADGTVAQVQFLRGATSLG